MPAKFSGEEFATKLGANGDPKLIAAADFAARLLSGPAGDRVARIVLFGSVARGEAQPESDIDVLVAGARDLDALQNQVADSAYDMLLEGSDYI
ncbi:MAG TPA: nucleotidyltransferase domain-containing protein [Anaerolineae bacterium]|nr:nucleotidyltransferase domain-containing protein [Anaerolineae bacterium]